MVTGTSKSHQRFPSKALKQTNILTGTPALFDVFNRIAVPVLTHLRASRAESRILATLWQTLAPRLVSGKIRLKQIAEFYESTVARRSTQFGALKDV